MATNMNMSRKPNVGLNDYNAFPIGQGEILANKELGSPNFQLPMSNNQLPQNAQSPLLGQTGPNSFQANNYGQTVNNFGRQFENSVEISRQRYSPLANMAAFSSRSFPQTHVPGPEQFQMNRFPMKFPGSDAWNANKSLEQPNYAQHQQTGQNSAWPPDFMSRNQRMMTGGKPNRDQGLQDASMNQNISIDPSFANHATGGQQQQQPGYNPMQSRPYLPGDVYKPPHEQQLRGMTPNFHHQDYYQQEQMRQMANAQQYQQAQQPHPGTKFMGPSQSGSPSPFPQPVIPKGTQDSIFSQFGTSPKANGPHPMMNMHSTNMVERGHVSFQSPSYPVSPVGSQLGGKQSSFGSPSLGMRGTVSPNVTIGLSKKQFQPQEEGVTSPSGNQNAAAAAAAAAVLAAINSANSAHTSPQSTGEMPMPPSSHVPPQPPPSSIHSKDGGSHSPATSISDHKSESGGSGINESGTAPSPAKSLTQSSPQLQQPLSSTASFSSDIATGRVPSPTMNQLPSSDIEARIHSVSNIPGHPMTSNEQPTSTSQRSKRESKSSSGLPKLDTGTTLSPVTPPSPFSLSPSITDFELDILSPSWEEPNNAAAVIAPSTATTASINRVYKLSDDPERKIFLDRLIMLAHQQGKSLSDIPIHNGTVLDLYKFYKLISERGGFHEVIRMKLWKEVIQALTNNSEPNPVESQTLRDHYVRIMLPFEAKFANTLPSQIVSSFPPSSGPRRSFPSPSQHGSIDLSSLNYKNLSMFQPPTNAPQFPGNNQPNRPPAYPSTTQAQNYPGSPMPHQMSNYRNVSQVPPGYPGHPSQSQRIPGYPGSPSQGYPNQQLPGYSGPPNAPHMPGYHPGYPGNSNVPPEAMYMREPHADFSRGAPHPMNKPYMQDPQHSSMFQNFPQPPQHPSMYPQQHFPMSKKQHFGGRSGPPGGAPSPDQRMQALHNQWGRKYSQGPSLPDPNLPTYQSSQSPKMGGGRPPPPYPKLEKGSMPTQGAPSPHLRMGARGSPRKEEHVFPSGCVEATKPMFPKKRRLTARDIGPVEAWRIMMSLKSGLLNESAWALDTLTILLCDDTTVGFFRLAHLPGLLDTIVEHFRRSLINVFAILEENEVDIGVPKKYMYKNSDEGTSNGSNLMSEDSFTAVIVADCIEASEQEHDELSFRSGAKTWSHGGGDTTVHIQTHFETDPGFYKDRLSTDDVEMDEQGQNYNTNKIEDDRVVGDNNMVDKAVQEEKVAHQDTADVDKMSSQKLPYCHEGLAYNGVSSPQHIRSKIKNVCLKESKYTVKSKIYCNGEDDMYDTKDLNIKQEAILEESRVQDPAESLIKRLKTELDLDVDCLTEESDILDSRTCNLPGAVSSEDECEIRQEFPLSAVTWSQNSAIKCCMCVSNIIRSLSFVPRNDVEMAKHPSLLLILGKLFLLHHLQKRKGLHGDDCQHSDKNCWWADCLEVVRENALVTVANIAGYLDLSFLADTVSVPLLDGLLHWLVCQSTTAVDSFQNTPSSMPLSPKNLALETLAKMSVLESNVDFILMSPNKVTLSKVYEYLVKLFSDKSNAVTREFALVLLSSLTQSDDTIPGRCSEINLITVLVGFLEDATESMQALAARGLHPGLFSDDDMNVSVGMLRRAAALLACIAKRNNSAHVIPFQERILTLSMSQLLDVEVQSHLSNVLYNLPR